jgi:serine/threonine-protein kinase RsbW
MRRETMGDLLKFSIPGKPEYVGVVRLAISSAANCAGFDMEAIEDIKVAVSEACTNVVTHGISDNNCYEVECRIEDNKIIILVTDDCGGYDLENYKEPCIGEPKEGGLGIFIIKALMDEVVIFSKLGEGTKIQMVKYII